MQTFSQSQMLLSIFGAPKLTMNDFAAVSEQTAFIFFIIPVIVACAVLESIFLWRERKKEQSLLKDAVANFITGVGFLISTTSTRTIMFALIIAIYNFTPWRQELNWWMFIPCYILHDFISYWKHRISHHSRFWWSMHIPHHSSEHYNLWINFRQSWFDQINVLFYIPLLLFGFHPALYLIVHAVNPLFQFWVHTEKIGRLPRWIEYFFVTPTSHKVHHASNEKYLDKNFGNAILIWDRMFGTYQDLDEQPVYGLTEPLKNNNAFHIVFDEALDIIQDVTQAKTFKEKMWMLFGSPGKIAKKKKLVGLINRNESSI